MSSARIARPASVPPEAEWVAEAHEWVRCARGPDGQFDGRAEVWRETGELCERLTFVGGKPHGEKTRLFEDGQVAQEEVYEHGVLRKHRGHRPRAHTADPHPFAGLPGSVRIDVEFDAEGFRVGQSLWSADGTLMLEDGRPAPPRPPGVSAQAYARVVQGEVVWQLSASKEGSVYKGLVLTWGADGALQSGHFFPAPGQQASAFLRVGPDLTRYEAGRDTLVVAVALEGRVEELEQAVAAGLLGTPGAQLHAALAGLADLAKRIGLHGRPCPDSRAEPPRGDVPAAASWVPGLGAFVLGAVEGASGHPVGHWSVWPVDDAFKPEGFATLFRGVAARTSRLLEADFEGGQLTHLVARGTKSTRSASWAGEALTAFEVTDAEGRHEFVAFREGATLALRFFEGRVLAAQAHTEGGVLVGEVRTFEPSGAVRTTAPVTGRWPTRFEADLEVERLRELVEEVVFRAVAPRGSNSPALAGVESIDWDELECPFTEGPLIPQALAALTVAEPLVHDRALFVLAHELEHQETLYPVTAAAMPFLLALLEAPHVPVDALLGVIFNIAAAAKPYLKQSLKAEAGKGAQPHHAIILTTLRAIDAGADLLGRVFERIKKGDRALILKILKAAKSLSPASRAAAKVQQLSKKG